LGEATFERERSFIAEGLGAAAVICRTPEGNLHLGVLHRTPERQAQIVHLGWQDRMSVDWPWERLWVSPEVDPETLFTAGAICRQVLDRFQQHRRFPYGFRFAQTSFARDGSLVLGPGAAGLSCSTFALAIFNGAGVRLIDEATWPIRTEEDRRFIATLRGSFPAEHLARLDAELTSGAQRIRPEEVAGACACLPLPAPFPSCAAAAQRVVAKLDGVPPQRP
jgi:hypothetical protein